MIGRPGRGRGVKGELWIVDCELWIVNCERGIVNGEWGRVARRDAGHNTRLEDQATAWGPAFSQRNNNLAQGFCLPDVPKRLLNELF